jgi:hypothetical protein
MKFLVLVLLLAGCFSQQGKKKSGFGLDSPQDSAGDAMVTGPTQPPRK